MTIYLFFNFNFNFNYHTVILWASLLPPLPFPQMRTTMQQPTSMVNKSVADVIDSVRTVGRETGYVKEGEAEAQRLEAGFDRIRAVVKEAEEKATPAQLGAATASENHFQANGGGGTLGRVFKRRKVAFLEWLEPLFNGGHWIPDVVRAAGGEYTMAEPGKLFFD